MLIYIQKKKILIKLLQDVYFYLKKNLQNVFFFKFRMIYIFIIASFFLLIILFKLQNPLQFYIKHFVYITATSLQALFLLPVFLFRPFDLKNAL